MRTDELEFAIPGDVGSVPSPESEAKDLQALRALVVECDELRQLERVLGRFNLFEVLRLTHYEIRHSNVLAWLLDPEGNHGLRDLFLRRWLMRVFHDNQATEAPSLDPVDLDSTPLRSVRVFREWANVDLLLELQTEPGKFWIVAIENKIGSIQHSQQLDRYRKRVLDAYPHARHAFILLSVVSEEPEDSAYVVATYGQVKEELERCLAEQSGAVGAEQRIVIDHYIQTIQNHFMPGSEVEKLALKIYSAHRRALDIIFEHRPDTTQVLTERVAAQVKEHGPALKVIEIGQGKGIVYLIPEPWKISQNKRSGGDLAVWCEINFYYMDSVVLKAVVGRAHQAWREELFQFSKTTPFPNTQNRKSLPQEWFQFYGAKNKGLNLQEVESGNAEETAARIWDWCAAQISGADFQQMVAVVANHLQKHTPPKPDVSTP